MDNISAGITEIFSSIQGEGPYLGQKQIFVRFSGCNLACKYCDTDIYPQENCKIYHRTDSFRSVKNPLHFKDLIEEVKKFTPELHHSISITGGEPLLHAEFLKCFFNELKKQTPGLKIYLETNGTLPDRLKLIVSYVDIVSMDIKLASSTGRPLPFDAHAEFIASLDSFYREFFIKIVVNPGINPQEIEQVMGLVRISRGKIPVILQPQSNQGFDDKILWAQNEFLKEIKDVRIIPQVHKYLNLR